MRAARPLERRGARRLRPRLAFAVRCTEAPTSQKPLCARLLTAPCAKSVHPFGFTAANAAHCWPGAPRYVPSGENARSGRRGESGEGRERSPSKAQRLVSKHRVVIAQRPNKGSRTVNLALLSLCPSACTCPAHTPPTPSSSISLVSLGVLRSAAAVDLIAGRGEPHTGSSHLSSRVVSSVVRCSLLSSPSHRVHRLALSTQPC
jgi:hypothetical protein